MTTTWFWIEPIALALTLPVRPLSQPIATSPLHGESCASLVGAAPSSITTSIPRTGCFLIRCVICCSLLACSCTDFLSIDDAPHSCPLINWPHTDKCHEIQRLRDIHPRE